jgi:hypothetical protein
MPLPQRLRLLCAVKRVECVGSDAGAVFGPGVIPSKNPLVSSQGRVFPSPNSGRSQCPWDQHATRRPLVRQVGQQSAGAGIGAIRCSKRTVCLRRLHRKLRLQQRRAQHRRHLLTRPQRPVTSARHAGTPCDRALHQRPSLFFSNDTA